MKRMLILVELNVPEHISDETVAKSLCDLMKNTDWWMPANCRAGVRKHFDAPTDTDASAFLIKGVE